MHLHTTHVQRVCLVSMDEESEYECRVSTAASCPYVDVLALHDYTTPELLGVRVDAYAIAAIRHNKRWIVQEFGSTASTESEKVDRVTGT